MRESTTRRSLGRGFNALLAASLVSNIGDGIRLAAIPLLATELTDSEILIASVTAAQYLPWITVAPVGGVLVDRWDRRSTIMITQLWRGLVMLGLALLVAGDVVALWHVCVVAFLITAGEILVDPAVFATVPLVVDEEDLERANGRIATTEFVANDFAGGPVGSVAFAAAPWLPFLIDGLSYLGSSPLFGRLPSRSERREQRGSVRQEARAGLDFLLGHPVLGGLLRANVVYFFGVATQLALLVVLVTRTLDASASVFGLVLAAGAVGATTGSMAAGRVRDRFEPGPVLVGTLLAQGVGLAAMATAPNEWVLLAIFGLYGFPVGLQRPVAQAIQQRLTPNEMLGRINVTSRMFTRGVIIVGAPVAGVVAELTSVRVAFAMAAVVVGMAALLTWRVLGAATASASR